MYTYLYSLRQSWAVVPKVLKRTIPDVFLYFTELFNCCALNICVCVCVCLELCGAFVVAFGEFQMVHSRFASLVTTFWPIYPANTLVVTGTIVTCVCFLGVLGSMKENRCMIITFFLTLFILILVELAMALVFLVYSREVTRFTFMYFQCCGVHGESDWLGKVPISCCVEDPCDGCLFLLKDWFSRNYLSTGAGVITMFIIQLVCICVTFPLFCHISRRGLGYQ
uniref:Leukocyte surface antigen CD53-like n=1 Tax=Cynoglossus semilaevis TaxID=244447 RepID=A0A3P8WGG8_CYNSE